jgi:hypothetical protein
MQDLVVTSASFLEGGVIPIQNGGQDGNLSPPLKWAGAPKETQYFAVKVDDPGASKGSWAHWMLINIPGSKTELAEGETAGKEITNDFGYRQYGGPCPPEGTHRYFYKVYALKEKLKDVNKENFDDIMKEKAIAFGQLMGTYTRK